MTQEVCFGYSCTHVYSSAYALSLHVDVYVTIAEVVDVPEASDNAVICIDPDITGNMDSGLTVVLEVNNGLAGKTL